VRVSPVGWGKRKKRRGGSLGKEKKTATENVHHTLFGGARKKTLQNKRESEALTRHADRGIGLSSAAILSGCVRRERIVLGGGGRKPPFLPQKYLWERKKKGKGEWRPPAY